jgi:hypothetical protein
MMTFLRAECQPVIPMTRLDAHKGRFPRVLSPVAATLAPETTIRAE